MTFAPSKLNRAVLLAMLTAGLAACGGEDGKDGAAGINGTNGVNGVDGTNGADGAPGLDGVDGDVTFEDSHTTAVLGTDLVFEGVRAPATDAEKRSIMASHAVVGDMSFGGSYNTFARSGDDINGVYFGQLVDQAGTLLKEEDGSIRISDTNEYTSLLPVGDRLFSVSQFESRPGAMYLMELDQNPLNGALSVKSLAQIDQSSVHGGWTHCAGSVTPWTTHLASEEYEPDAKLLPTVTEAAADNYAKGMLNYYPGEDKSQWNPYFYGWNIEVAVSEDASVDLTKHYAMGRMAFELSLVLPDSKTTYMTDDGTNVGFYMFVADNAGDLSAGTTYVAKWNQTSGVGLGSADLEWINLGHATDAEIAEYVTGGTTFTDIFDAVSPSEGVCPEGYSSINANSKGQECLAVKEGMAKAASRLETRRYAAMMGGTTEFRKEEGVTFDSKRNKLYVAMSEVKSGMMAGDSNDVGGPDHIQLETANSCGGVYQLDLAADSTIGSDYVAQNMSGIVAGRPVSESDPQEAGYENNTCHINGIASPDNVTYMSGYDYLIIGEDTNKHQNDVIWAYDFDDSSLTRIQTTPYGSETTSPYWYPNINGWSYLTSVIQHPYDESDKDENTGAGEARAYTGYIGPFPGVTEE